MVGLVPDAAEGSLKRLGERAVAPLEGALGRAEDERQRCAELVGYVREEPALGLIERDEAPCLRLVFRFSLSSSRVRAATRASNPARGV